MAFSDKIERTAEAEEKRGSCGCLFVLTQRGVSRNAFHRLNTRRVPPFYFVRNQQLLPGLVSGKSPSLLSPNKAVPAAFLWKLWQLLGTQLHSDNLFIFQLISHH